MRCEMYRGTANNIPNSSEIFVGITSQRDEMYRFRREMYRTKMRSNEPDDGDGQVGKPTPRSCGAGVSPARRRRDARATNQDSTPRRVDSFGSSVLQKSEDIVFKTSTSTEGDGREEIADAAGSDRRAIRACDEPVLDRLAAGQRGSGGTQADDHHPHEREAQ